MANGRAEEKKNVRISLSEIYWKYFATNKDCCPKKKVYWFKGVIVNYFFKFSLKFFFCTIFFFVVVVNFAKKSK